MARLKMHVEGCAVTYEAEDLEAGIAMHAHEPGSAAEHTTKCTAGSVLLGIHPGQVVRLKAGELAEFDSTKWHVLVPLEVGARWVNRSRARLMEDTVTVVNSPHNAPQWVLDAVKEISNV